MREIGTILPACLLASIAPEQNAAAISSLFSNVRSNVVTNMEREEQLGEEVFQR